MDGLEPGHIELARADMLLRKADCDVLIVGHAAKAFRLDARSSIRAALLRTLASG